MKKFLKLNEARKSFLMLWIVIMILPTIFIIGMVLEKNNIRVITERNNRVYTYTRTMQWSDTLLYFISLIVGTICIYWMVGLLEKNKQEGRNDIVE